MKFLYNKNSKTVFNADKGYALTLINERCADKVEDYIKLYIEKDTLYIGSDFSKEIHQSVVECLLKKEINPINVVFSEGLIR